MTRLSCFLGIAFLFAGQFTFAQYSNRPTYNSFNEFAKDQNLLLKRVEELKSKRPLLNQQYKEAILKMAPIAIEELKAWNAFAKVFNKRVALDLVPENETAFERVAREKEIQEISKSLFPLNDIALKQKAKLSVAQDTVNKAWNRKSGNENTIAKLLNQHQQSRAIHEPHFQPPFIEEVKLFQGNELIFNGKWEPFEHLKSSDVQIEQGIKAIDEHIAAIDDMERLLIESEGLLKGVEEEWQDLNLYGLDLKVAQLASEALMEYADILLSSFTSSSPGATVIFEALYRTPEAWDGVRDFTALISGGEFVHNYEDRKVHDSKLPQELIDLRSQAAETGKAQLTDRARYMHYLNYGNAGSLLYENMKGDALKEAVSIFYGICAETAIQKTLVRLSKEKGTRSLLNLLLWGSAKNIHKKPAQWLDIYAFNGGDLLKNRNQYRSLIRNGAPSFFDNGFNVFKSMKADKVKTIKDLNTNNLLTGVLETLTVNAVKSVTLSAMDQARLQTAIDQAFVEIRYLGVINMRRNLRTKIIMEQAKINALRDGLIKLLDERNNIGYREFKNIFGEKNNISIPIVQGKSKQIRAQVRFNKAVVGGGYKFKLDGKELPFDRIEQKGTTYTAKLNATDFAPDNGKGNKKVDLWFAAFSDGLATLDGDPSSVTTLNQLADGSIDGWKKYQSGFDKNYSFTLNYDSEKNLDEIAAGMGRLFVEAYGYDGEPISQIIYLMKVNNGERQRGYDLMSVNSHKDIAPGNYDYQLRKAFPEWGSFVLQEGKTTTVTFEGFGGLHIKVLNSTNEEIRPVIRVNQVIDGEVQGKYELFSAGGIMNLRPGIYSISVATPFWEKRIVEVFEGKKTNVIVDGFGRLQMRLANAQEQTINVPVRIFRLNDKGEKIGGYSLTHTKNSTMELQPGMYYFEILSSNIPNGGSKGSFQLYEGRSVSINRYTE
ncbi:hypothetical protein [Spongiimicrobium sp. 3-5]|uniref:hypothetical protein n=1 Tax=Spongiimicrobium sp. 3-5 TaxID=3332596 RepID=UPI0039815118